VYLPNALSFIVMGIKIGIALGLVMLVVSEMVGAASGIGWLLVESKEFFRIDRMVVCMITLGFIGWFFIEIMKYIESRLALWKVGR
jgi:ABC-type nitrate/sulfonate/bicarbonate transport system permease component